MEFLFIKYHDVEGNDALRFPKHMIENRTIPKEIFNYPCFTTDGIIKSNIQKVKKLEYISESNQGIYVKNALNQIPIKVINLERRPDRWEKMVNQFKNHNITTYERFNAVDGTKLVLTDELKLMFRNNDFSYKRGMVGVALSHMNLWKELTESKNDYFVIMEDDFEVVSDFKNKLNIVFHQLFQNPYIDLAFLGHFYWDDPPKKLDEFPIFQKLEHSKYMGGAYGYIISKSGAFKYLNIIKYFGVQRAIDNFMVDNANKMISVVCEPHIVHSDYVKYKTYDPITDSDIQRDHNPVPPPDQKYKVVPLLHAGLGNQLFMIANAYALAKLCGKEFKIQNKYYGYRTHYFNTLLKNIIPEEIDLNGFREYTEPHFHYKNIDLNNYGNVLLKGYYQSEKYFENCKDEIRQLFKLPQELEQFAINKLKEYELNQNLVLVHIRRGDYVNHPLHPVQSLDYYKNAISIMKHKLDNISFLYFSDDKQWVNDNIELMKKDYIIECENDYEEFAMMQQCHHFIIANSSFSWWAAWLSNKININDKIVIAPKLWFGGNELNPKDIYCNNWIIL